MISFTPIIIILGNIVPPFPIKIHFLAFGLVFLCTLYLLMYSKYQLTAFIFGSILVVSQFLLNYWDIKNIIDFLFGPFVLLAMVDILVNKKVPMEILLKYQKRFYFLLWIPLIIAVFQYLNILPIAFWNASYINYAYVNDLPVPRPNGFLYHGSELSIIICFVALFQFFNKKKLSVFLFCLAGLVAYMTYFKAIVGCVVALSFVFIVFKLKVIMQLFSKIPNVLIKTMGIVAAIFIGILLSFVCYQSYKNTGYFFDPQLMTGRGSIWNIFTDAISDYSIFNYLFGSGIGSGPHIFETYASANNYYILSVGQELDVAYDAHNAVLSLFINSGLFGLVGLGLLLKLIFSNVKKWQSGARRNKYLLIAFLAIILLTIGITIPIFDMAIFWPCIGFLLIKWKNLETYEVE